MNWFEHLTGWIGRMKCWYFVRPWEAGILVRCGRWVTPVGPGLHVRLPFFDEVFVQNTRLRVLNLPVQTVTARDGRTFTLSGSVRWRIADVHLAYEKLHTPEDWILNAVLATIAEAIHTESEPPTPSSVSAAAERRLAEARELGLEIDGVAVTDFVAVRTYRLITGEGNTGWTWNRVGPLDVAKGP